MSESLEVIRKRIDECSDDDRRALKLYLRGLLPHPLERDWGIDADTILSAISRSSDLTRRGIRGIIAEAVFVNDVIPTVFTSGWRSADLAGEHPYDALLTKGDIGARVQVKLQRLQQGTPKLYYPRHYEKGSLFVVEVQKTRTGEKITRTPIPGTNKTLAATESITVKTRPYSFGDFDILAVNLHPSSGNWKSFRYTLASWLIPRSNNSALMEIFQPVAAIPNERWTDDLSVCLRWFEIGEQRRILPELIHLRNRKKE